MVQPILQPRTRTMELFSPAAETVRFPDVDSPHTSHQVTPDSGVQHLSPPSFQGNNNFEIPDQPSDSQLELKVHDDLIEPIPVQSTECHPSINSNYLHTFLILISLNSVL